MNLYLVGNDLRILERFEDGRDHSHHDIAEDLGIPPWAARSSIQALRRYRLITRSFDPRLCGRHHITEIGHQELNERRQLRLVESEL